MKVGHPCRLCGETLTPENVEQRLQRKSQRMKAAKQKAKAEGKRIGRGIKQYDYDHIVKLYHDGLNVTEIAQLLGSSRSPVKRAIKAWRPLPNTNPKRKH